MALTPFNGELDSPAGLEPFSGKLDGESKDQDSALVRGAKNAWNSIKTGGALLTGDADLAATLAAERDSYRRANPGTKEGNELMKAWESGDGVFGGISNVAGEMAKDWREAPGVLAGIRETGKNLSAMGGGIVEQIPNMVAPMGGMLAGGAAGSMAGPVGTVGGAWAGATAGNTLVESGEQVDRALMAAGINPQDKVAVRDFLAKNGDTILGQAGTKGAIIGAVDTATLGLGGALLRAPAKAAVERAIASGINPTDNLAIQAAVKADPIYQASKSGVSALGRNATVAALEPAGEFTGEYIGQGVATGDWDTKGATLEALSSLGQSGITFAGQKLYDAATSPLRNATPDGSAPEVSTPETTAQMDALNADLGGAAFNYTNTIPSEQKLLPPGVITVPNDSGGETVVDANNGPISSAAVTAVTTGAAAQLQAGTIEGGVPFSSREAAQKAIDSRDDAERLQIIPHPRVKGAFATVPKDRLTLQALDQANLRRQQLEQEDGNASTMATTSGQGSSGISGGGAGNTQPVGGVSTGRSGVAGTSDASRRADLAMGDASAADASLDELAPPPVQPVSSMPGIVKRDQQAAEQARLAAEARGATLIDEEAGTANQAPSEAQIAAGNYKKGHVKVGPIDISVENPVGSTRTGKEGKKSWSTTMQAHYGYVKRTIGNDGDQVDVFIKANTANDHAGPVYVIDQFNPKTGRFDEHKAMIGYGSAAEASAAYDAHFSDKSGPKRRKSVIGMTPSAFNDWAKNGDTSRPLSQSAKEADAAQAEIEQSTGKLSRKRAGESDSDYQYRMAAEKNQAKAARQQQAETATDAEEIETIRQATKNPDGELSIVSDDAMPDMDKASPRQVSKQAATFMRHVAKLFGKEIVFVDGMTHDGFYQQGNKIYISTRGNINQLRILGHEMLHAMKRQHHDAYEKLIKALGAITTDAQLKSQFKDYFALDKKMSQMSDEQIADWLKDSANREMILEEMMADLSGNRWAESSFWESVFTKIDAKYGSEQAKGIIAKLRLALVNALNKLMSLVRGGQFSVDARVADHLEAVREALATGFADYAKAVKDKQTTEGVGEVKFAKSPGSDIGHKRNSDGRYVGSPDWVGASPSQVTLLRKKLHGLAIEGEPGRMWYERSSEAILELVNGNKAEAEKIVQLIAIYSPSNAVPGNTTMAIKAYYQWKQGLPIRVGTTNNDKKANELLYQGKEWSGIKTNSFYQNLMQEIDPSKNDAGKATMDMWMALAFDYGMKTVDQGPKYGFMEREIQRLARELKWTPHQVQAAIWTAMKGRIDPIRGELTAAELDLGWHNAEATAAWKNGARKEYMERRKKYLLDRASGKKVSPPEIKLAGIDTLNADRKKDHYKLAHKMGMEYDLRKSDIEESKYDFSDAIKQRTAQMSWEATPGKSTMVLPGIHDAPMWQQMEYLAAMQKAFSDADGNDIIGKEVGLAMAESVQGFSGWQGASSVGIQDGVVVPPNSQEGGLVQGVARDAINLVADIRGLVLNQEGVAWHYPIYTGSKNALNGIEFNIGRLLTEAENASLYQALIDELGHTFSPPIPTQDGQGFRVLNFPDEKFALMGEFDDGADLLGLDGKHRKTALQKSQLAKNEVFRDAVHRAVAKQPWQGDVVDHARFETDGELRENDWSNGDSDYRGRIAEAVSGSAYQGANRWSGRSDIFEWIDNDLRPKADAVNRQFAQKYGWAKQSEFKFSPARNERPETDGGVAGQGRPGDRQLGRVDVTGTHYSREQRKHLTGGYFGTGLAGEEGKRLKEAKDTRLHSRLYAYVNEGQGVFPEAGVGAYAHTVKFDNLYDLKADPLGILQKTRDANDRESLILDAGFDGYYAPGVFGRQGVAILMGGAATRGVTPTDAVAPAVNAETTQKPARRTDLPMGKMTGSEWKKLDPRATELEDDKSYYRDDIKFSPARISPEAEKEIAAIEKRLAKITDSSRAMVEANLANIKRGLAGEVVRDADGNLLAPNGRKSKLTEEQYLQVRSPAFMKWFGDWLAFHNAKNGDGVWADGDKAVSKVVDENGEPAIIYHGTEKGGFTVMRPDKGDKHRSPMVFATDDRRMARTYSWKSDEIDLSLPEFEGTEARKIGKDWFVVKKGGDSSMAYNVYGDYVDVLDAEGYASKKEVEYFRDNELEQYLRDAGDVQRGVYSMYLNIRDPHETDFEGANWDGSTNGLFEVLGEDGDNIYSDDGRRLMPQDEAEAIAEENEGAEVNAVDWLGETTNSVAEEAKQYGKDGAIIRNVVDDGGRYPGGIVEPATVFVFFGSNQAKSATQNNGRFSQKNDDIRYSPARIMVDGVERPTENSNGKPIHPTEEGIRNFWRWFKDSKVVDNQGRPMVVYHGTDAEDDFSAFARGSHFGTLNQADSILDSKDTKYRLKRMMPVYLNVQKLKRVRDVEIAARWNDEVKKAIAQGYDGLVYKNEYEDDTGADSYVVFNPEQVKSAIGNLGTFDATNPDIRYSPPRWYFSPLEKAFESAPDRVFGQAQQVKLWLAGNKAKLGLKDDEIFWTGINDWLDMRGKAKVSRAEVLAYLAGNGVQEAPNKKKVKEIVDKAVQLYSEGLSSGAVAEQMGLGETTVLRWVKRAGITRTVQETKGVTAEKIEAAVAAYLNGEAVASAAKIAGIGGSTLHRVLKARGLSRSLSETVNAPAEIKQRAIELFRGGLTTYEVAEDVGVAQSTVSKWVKDAGVSRSYSDAQALRVANGRLAGYGIKSKFASDKSGQTLPADSVYELARFYQLESDDSVKSFSRAKDRIKYGENSTYVPDIRVVYNDGRVVVEEIKPEVRLLDEKVVEKAKAAESYYAEKGIEYRIINERDIGIENFDKIVPEDVVGKDDVKRVKSSLATLRWSLNKQPGFTVTPAMSKPLPLFSRARAQTETPEFKRWFGDSKVVDAKGKPLVVYHGTAADFGVFDAARAGYNYPTTGAQRGMFFTSNQGTASVYAEKPALAYLNPTDQANAEFGDGTANIMPVYLRIENPLAITTKKSPDKYLDQNSESIYSRVEKGGHDGVIIRGGAEFKRDLYVAFSPTQIKSAIGNNGDFDPANPDIRRSPARSAATNKPLSSSWASTEVTSFDNIARQLQDKQIDTKRVVEAIRAAGIAIKDAIDPYLQEILYHGRAAKRTQDFAEQELRPLLQSMQMRGVSMQEIEDYLWAKHAPERNAQNAKIGFQGDGSGLTDGEARAILAGQRVTKNGRDIQLNAAKMASYDALSQKVKAINDKTLDTLVEYGLETQATVDQWRRTYKHYVPLMRDMTDDNYTGANNRGLGTGKGFSIRGSASKRAIGSERGVIDIMANIAMQRERAITRGEKNRVSQATYGLAITAPNPDFWLPIDPAFAKNPAAITRLQNSLIQMGINPIDAQNIAQEPVQSYIDPRTGMASTRINPTLRGRDDVLAVRINGEDKFLLFSSNNRAQEMVRNLKNLDDDQLGGFLQASAKITRWFAAINTQYNPVFGLVNGVRDFGSAMLNLSSTPLQGQQKRVAAYGMDALLGIYKDLRDHRAGRTPSSGWELEFEEFANEGGQTGYRDMFNTSEQRTEALADELKKMANGNGNWTRADKNNPVFAWLSDYNTAIENAFRVAAYKVAKENGMSKQQAAALAKNLTVNFNKKGLAATQTGALYAFFNAAVQGTARIVGTLLEHRGNPSDYRNLRLSSTGKKIVVGGVMLGVMQALLGAAAGWDDDEPKQFQRERNLIIPLPGTDNYISIPYPLGFHVLPNLGRIVTEYALSGFKDTGKRLTQLLGAMSESFNPLGSSGLSLQTISPTFADPLVALATNQDWNGQKIFKEDFNKNNPTPGWSRTKDTATPWSKALAYGLNYISGGGEYSKGLISPTPDQIDFLIGQAFGGVGREAGKVAQTVGATAKGEELPMYKIPVVGRFVGETTGVGPESGKYYDNLERIGAHKDPIKRMREDGKNKEVMEYYRDHPEARLVKQADKTQQDISELRSLKRKLEKRNAPQERINAINEQIKTRMRMFSTQVKQLEKQAA